MYSLDVPYMETKRLILRETDVSDCHDMFEYAQLDFIGPVAGWPPHQKLSDTKNVLRSFNAKKITGQLGTVAIVLKENNKMIGTVELHSYEANFKAELGYTLNPKYWGQGIMTEAVKILCDYAFNELNKLANIIGKKCYYPIYLVNDDWIIENEYGFITIENNKRLGIYLDKCNYKDVNLFIPKEMFNRLKRLNLNYKEYN